MATQAQIKAVQQLYVGYLGRAADSAGLAFWADAIAAGTATIESVATGFTLSTEYKAAYDGLSSGDLVDNVYNNVLGRAADAEGKAYWVDALAKGTVTADTLVSFIVTNLGAVDQATINNKTFVAQTYTDAAGANYNVEAGTSVLVGVDSTPASVTAALASISNGTLPGQVPSAGLIAAVDTALADQVAFETANKTAADALVTKLAANTATSQTDGITATSTYADKIAAVVADATSFRATAGGGEADTTVLETRAATAASTLATDFAALSVTEKAAANKYVAAIAAEATAKAGAATATEKGAAIGGLTADATATAALTAHTGTAEDLFEEYVTATAAERTAIDTEFADSTFYATFKAAAAKDAAYADAIKATLAAKDVLDSGTATSTTTTTVNGVAITGAADTTDGSAAANKYANDLLAKTAADKLVTDAKAADVDLAAAKALADAYAVKTDATLEAVEALAAAPAVAGVSLHATTVGAGAITFATTSAAKDVFYFAPTETAVGSDLYVKAALVGANDGTIASFAAGDAIVLGSTYTYNSGALSTGNNSASEFFLVQKGSDTLVVLETAVYGSASVTGTAAGATTVSPDAAVITLTGVSVADLTVNNGVISHVA